MIAARNKVFKKSLGELVLSQGNISWQMQLLKLAPNRQEYRMECPHHHIQVTPLVS